MRRMRTWTVLTAAIVAAAALAAHADAKSEPASCARPGARTLLATQRAIVFARHDPEIAYACLFKKGKARRLGEVNECQSTTQASAFRLGGRYVGYERTTCGLESGFTSVRVLDLSTGRTKWSAPGAQGTAGPGDDTTEVTALEMKADGSVAWIGYFDQSSNGLSDPATDVRQVRKLEPGAPAGGALVDSGLDIAEGSLALARRSTDGATPFYWTKGGVAQSSPLR